jgi:hypothetical protein
VSLAQSWGVVIATSTVTLNNAATCAGVGGFSQVAITYNFITVAPELLPSLGSGFTVPVSACFPNNT